MKVSILILIYNIEEYLHKCIDSAINQTYKDLEIILVNDGSTDGSLEVCKFFKSKDNRVKIIDKANGGLASARKAGVLNATGSFVVFLDGDDYLELNAIEILIAAYNKSKADLIIASAKYIFKNKTLPLHNIHHEQFLDKNEYINYLIEGKYPWMLAAKLFNIELLRDIGMPYYKVGQDAIVCFQYTMSCDKLFVINEQIYNYVQRLGSASYSKERENIVDTYRFAKDVASFLEISNLPKRTKSLLPFFEVRWFISALHKGGYNFLKDSMKDISILYPKSVMYLKTWERLLFVSYNKSPHLGIVFNKLLHHTRKVLIYLKNKR